MNVDVEKMLLLMDDDAIRVKFQQHAEGDDVINNEGDNDVAMTFKMMKSSTFGAALRDLGIRKNDDELDDLMEKHDLNRDGHISEDEFLAAVHSKSQVELMLDSLPIVRALSHSLLSSRKKSMQEEDGQNRATPSVQRFIEMTQEEITENLSEIVDVITAIILKQHAILNKEAAEDDGTYSTLSNAKFKLETRGGSLDDFNSSLASHVGACHADPVHGMESEHLNSLDSDLEFTTPNYVIKSTPKIEYRLATTGGNYYKDLAARLNKGERLLNLTLSPMEKLIIKNKGNPLNRFGPNRRIRSIDDYRQLPIVQRAKLSEAEIIAVLLYTGPMYVLWNAALCRSPSDLHKRLEDAHNNYSSSLHVLSSAIKSIQQSGGDPHIWPSTTLFYRGLSGSKLPPAIFAPDNLGRVGMTFYSIQSTTSNLEVAVDFTGLDIGEVATVLEIRGGQVDNGAYLGDLSQYPEEKEYIWPAVSYIQASGDRRMETTRDGELVEIIPVRINSNNRIMTLDEVQSYRKDQVKGIYKDIERDLRRELDVLKKNPLIMERAKSNSYYDLDATLVKVHHWFEVQVDKKRPSWFNDDTNYKQVIGKCSDWKSKLDNLANEETTLEEKTKAAALTLCRIHELIGSSADELWDNETRTTILMYFARSGDLSTTSLLIDAGADVNMQDKTGLTALMQAIKSHHTEVVEYLLAFPSINTNLRDNTGATPLHHAVRTKKLDLVRMTAQVTDVNIEDEEGKTALMAAVLTKRSKIAHWLCQKSNTDVNTQDVYGCTALHYAVQRRDFSLVKTLAGCSNVNIQDKEGQTALMHAVDIKERELVQLLLTEFQANTSLRDKSGWTVLHFAVQALHIDIVRLIANVVDVNIKDDGGHTALMYAAHIGQLEVVELLYKEFNADVSAATDSNETTLMWACSAGQVDVVKFLLDNCDANLFEKDDLGQTPLHVAASGGQDIVKFLVERGLGVDVPDSAGCTAFMHACVQKNLGVAKWLADEANADKWFRSEEGTTALMLASEMGHENVVNWLLKDDSDNIDTDGCNEEGVTALMLACDGGHLAVVKLLVDGGANPNATSNNGHTPLMCASEEDHLDIVNFLIQRRMEASFNRSKQGDFRDGC